MTESGALKLRTEDAEDLRVLAAVLQDALMPLSDIAYQKRQRRVVLIANRFMWEDHTDSEETEKKPDSEPSSTPKGDATFADEAPPARFRRVNCGLRFEGVANVQIRGLDLRRRDAILNLLTFDIAPDGLILLFSEGAAIRLQGKGIRAILEDLGEPWPTDWRPSHRLDDSEQPD